MHYLTCSKPEDRGFRVGFPSCNPNGVICHIPPIILKAASHAQCERKRRDRWNLLFSFYCQGRQQAVQTIREAGAAALPCRGKLSLTRMRNLLTFIVDFSNSRILEEMHWMSLWNYP